MNRPRTSSSSSSPPSSASSAATASPGRSEEHTSELQSSQISYAVFCLKKKNRGGGRAYQPYTVGRPPPPRRLLPPVIDLSTRDRHPHASTHASSAPPGHRRWRPEPLLC